MFDFGKKDKKDFASVGVNNEVANISVPTIPIKKYPVIIKKGTEIVEKLAAKMDDPKKFLEELNVVSLLKYIPQIIDLATQEFFSLTAFVLDVEIERVEDLSLADLMRVLTKLAEVNEMVEITGPLFGNLREKFNPRRK